ncbi:hypothetical protein BOTBODRAFT_32793 [Botryobasidium botryosum FD-172 SS1]|uniref:tRNA pseudouridine(55) synthase n=1 Tax=Botryobasidium botryosum (strain FD-172 SS1) TaxID=930990 RepID=A0A067MR73_BOTB1|nr:hypothetical protein BOTBODRAFT_32793 [Botryobasidium botryosum FD-172 SS1]
MPKAENPAFPLNGLIGLAKPSGPPSMVVLDRLKKLFALSELFVPEHTLKQERQAYAKKFASGSAKKGRGWKGKDAVKMGQGGTLDPLADGVLVLGIGKGTKLLGNFLHCSKEYHTTCILGCETDTYDSEGARVRTAPWSHITREKVESVLENFRGEILQTPPIYSALKMQGKPLYEYAREGKPLPEPIKARQARVDNIELVGWQDAASTGEGAESSPQNPGHNFKWPTKMLGEADIKMRDEVRKLVDEAGVEDAESGNKVRLPQTQYIPEPTAPSATTEEQPTTDERIPPVFMLKMTVSSGTYVRSIVHDIGLALGSAAHVVTLTRTRQGDFSLGDENSEGNCLKWDVLEQALEKMEKGEALDMMSGESERSEWEKDVLEKWQSCP